MRASRTREVPVLHVLVVLQNDRVRQALVTMVRGRSGTVCEARGVEEALSCLEVRPPDLLLLGSRFPDGQASDILEHAHDTGVKNVVQVDDESRESCENALAAGMLGAASRRTRDDAPADRMPGRGVPGMLRIRTGTSIEEAERRLILTTLAHCDGRRGLAARRLGIGVEDLYSRLEKYGYTMVDADDFAPGTRGSAASGPGTREAASPESTV
jgi:DNA-binding NtrC family response regulator